MIAALQALDSRTLLDIGIGRDEIERFVDGLDEHELRMAPPQHAVRTDHSLGQAA